MPENRIRIFCLYFMINFATPAKKLKKKLGGVS